MEGFKTNPKMQCFKEGGQVKYETRKEHKEEMSSDVNQDKKIVKKAFKMHDSQEHKGEHTDLSKLKKGGRAKKPVGSVKKYACGGGVFGAKKTKEDIKNMDAAKTCKPKKLADGGMTGMGAVSDAEREMVQPSMKGQGAVSETERRAMAKSALGDMEKQRQMDRIKRAQKYLGPSQQGEFGGQEREFLGRKKGGSIKKCATGGSLKETKVEENPGLAKLPTNVRNKMGYMNNGGKACK